MPDTDPVLRPINAPAQALVRLRISGWLRQNRCRAKKSNTPITIALSEVTEIYKHFEYKCAYCGEAAGSPDHPFPIKTGNLCVPANILPCCDGCRSKKKGRDVVQFHRDGYVSKEQLRAIIRYMLERQGGDRIRDYIKEAYSSK